MRVLPGDLIFYSPALLRACRLAAFAVAQNNDALQLLLFSFFFFLLVMVHKWPPDTIFI